MEFLLVIFITLFYLSTRKRCDYFLVEIRMWRDGTFTPYARNYTAYTRHFLKKRGLRVYEKSSGYVEFYGGSCFLKIKQRIFTSLDAADLYFDTLTKNVKGHDAAIELVLWRVVARSRNGAYVITPSSYASREGVILRIYQPHFPPRPPSDADDSEYDPAYESGRP